MTGVVPDRFGRMWAELEPIGRDPSTGGYRRFAWTEPDLECRAWFGAAAAVRDLDLEANGNGNLWAWWGDPSAGDAVVIGSHLDSVPDGGAFDGPLGVVSAFAAVDALRDRGVVPRRPVAVVAFSNEEGARFGVACGGSRLLTGALPAERGLSLTDADGTTMAEAMRAVGHDPALAGADPQRLGRIGVFVELHVEQGRVPVVATGGSTVAGLQGFGSPVGVASSIWPHGRWRFDLSGRADHAGTTALGDRDDPMLRLAAMVSTARDAAARADAVATVGRVLVEPNGVNAIPSSVRAWLDARGADETRVRRVVADVAAAAGAGFVGAPAGAAMAGAGAAGMAMAGEGTVSAPPAGAGVTSEGAVGAEATGVGPASAGPAAGATGTGTGTGTSTGASPAGVSAGVVEESWTPDTVFDTRLRDRVVVALRPRFGPVPVLPTGAGHDAGVLSAAGVPTAMLFVRNPTGVSHSPAEFAERDDCLAGVAALADVVEALL